MISVIIPAYQAERTIERAVNSIQRQTFQDWELIVVNDGSTDRTLEILNAISSNDSRVRRIDIPNGGAYHARLHGVKVSRGEWVTFLDSDDSLPEDSLENLFEILKESGGNADISVGTLEFYGAVRKQGARYHHRVSGLLTSVEYQNAILSGFTSIGNVAKLYKKNLFENSDLSAERYAQNEDLLLLLKLAKNSENGIFIDTERVVYKYVRRRGSASAVVLPARKWFELFRAVNNSLIVPDSEDILHYKLRVLFDVCILGGADFRGTDNDIKTLRNESKGLVSLSQKERATLFLIQHRIPRLLVHNGFLILRSLKRLLLD